MSLGRVGYVLRWFPARSETFVAREIAALCRQGVDIDVASLGTRGDEAGALGVDTFVAHAPRGATRLRYLHHLRPGDRLPNQRAKDLLRLGWLRRLTRTRGWERVHVHFAGEALEVVLAAQLGLPVSVTVHASDLFRPRPGLTEMLRRVRVLTVCEHHRAWLDRHHGVDATVVRCGVDVDVPRARLGGAGPLGVVSVARDVPKKNLDQLVRCLPDDARLHLISDAVRLSSERVRVQTLPPPRVVDALLDAQLFVLPCRVAEDGDRDGVPVALMEAMACGLPVIAGAVSGVPELVDDSVGWLVPPGDDEALRRAFAEAADPMERQRRGEAARVRVLRGWTLEQQATGWIHALSPVAC